MNISTATLRALLSKALAEYEELHGTQVEIGPDMYWSLPFEALYDLSQASPSLEVGSFVDELEQLRDAVAADEGRVGSTGLQSLSAIIRYMSDEVLRKENTRSKGV